MVTRNLGPTIVSAGFLQALLREQGVAGRALVVAQQAAESIPGGAALVYLIEGQGEDAAWVVKASVGEIHLDQNAVPLNSGTLGSLVEGRKARLFSGREIVREDYAHLHARRTPVSLAYFPILNEDVLIGALEVAAFAAALGQADLAMLQELANISAAAMIGGLSYEQERNSYLQSITRLTQLYDLEKVFNSTLEMDEVMPIIAAKSREALNVQAVHLWMIGDEEELLLTGHDGADPTIPEGSVQRSGEGIAAEVADLKEPLLIGNPNDERLTSRNALAEPGTVFSVMAAPLITHQAEVGVLEAVNKLDGTPFDEDDLFFLTSIAETAASALHNANLMHAERKVEVMEALVRTSGEITSTLDLDRVLQAVVNGPASVIPYERSAIALEQRGRIQLKAVSGATQLNPDDPQYRGLNDILQWAAVLNDSLLVTQHGEQIDTDHEGTRAKFQQYFADTGMRALHVVPLADEEGRVGVLTFESSDPDFLSEVHLEMIKVLASQATVALRNASLYKEVPFIGVLEPLLQKKQRFLAMEKRRRTALLVSAAAVILFLMVFPLPLRVDGTAIVAPARAAHVGAELEGVVKQVNVREGDRIQKGAVLASLEDWEYRSALAGAKAKYETAFSQMNRALASSDGAEAGIQRAQADYWSSEVARAQERLEQTFIRSPIDGVVATPHIESLVGRKLKFGDTFAEIVDNSQALVDVTIDERDVSLVHSGQGTRIKLDGFPARTFRGEVVIVSPQGQLRGDDRVFYARVSVPNNDGALRSGMQGLGKVSTGWRPAGVVLFRRIAMWGWGKLWDWFGW
jgi:RND family efflux transporter MFP subunit